ncbi:serine hydrolase domain-containing protein [Nocardia sp. bgisy118]|uniref:serine hydrolase domain-containing protein n=1 Tax=Nocardia sp. bgisy118 TaxID=3413786 RepID=UPI003F4A38CE
MQEDIDRAVGAGVTGAIATVTENGATEVRTAGVADLRTSAPIPAQPPQRTRVGSVTKSFTSALVLQLVAEGKVRLDEPIADTYLPAPGERDIRGPHPAGYATSDGVVTDVSRIEPSIPWAAGALVSSGADLNHFYGALLAGRVLAAAELEQIRAGVPIDPESGMVYGLGLGSMRLSCGAEYVGHNGAIHGYYTLSGATVDGRAVTVAMTKAPETEPDLIGMLEHALCP